ncbi:zona pellucida sperm-binding protein 4-like [Rana temporaria]|uniref:zona pellucida sperm-binding protein 4-like n=1 Tax=Rana temporaria TaxID=8407 RepID=UPI001AAC71DF|nr:zona pellucida sperm-binding protein 4-like [Rana temporaria]
MLLSTALNMVPLLLLDGIWLLLLAGWPLFGLCSSSTEIGYLCGHEGVQIKVPPDYLGTNVTFLVRDEFEMAYDIEGCISKCVFSARKPNGESIFFVSYQICISFREAETWKLRVRFVGSKKSEDINIVCSISKEKTPRVITHKTMSTRMPQLTTVPTWTTPLSSTLTKSVVLANTTLPTKTSLVQDEGKDQKPTTPSSTVPGTKESDVTVETKKNVTSKSPLPIVRRTTSRSQTYPDLLNETQCFVPNERVPCLDSSVSRDTCLHYRCCHDPEDPITPCYYGHTVTANCSSDGFFQLVISRYVTNPPLLLSSIVLGLGTCPTPAIIGDFLVVTGKLLACSTPQFVQGQPIYELSIIAKQDVLVSSSGSITRDSTLTVTLQCLYNITLSLKLVSSVEPPPPFPSVTNSGVLDVDLHVAKGPDFSAFYTSMDYPLQILLRDPIFFEARLLQPSDPRLHLRLHHCWGAPNLEPVSTIRWPLIYDGCPYTDDDPMTNILPGPVPSGYQRFVVSAFTFLDFSNQSQVFVFCSISVCVPSSNETCTSDCSSLKRGRRFKTDYYHHLVKTAGPLVFQRDGKTGLASFQHLTVALPGILFAVALLVLLCLVVVFKRSFTVRSRNLNVTSVI